jgi:hypothetical protein
MKKVFAILAAELFTIGLSLTGSTFSHTDHSSDIASFLLVVFSL